jgi:hypothetical protein
MIAHKGKLILALLFLFMYIPFVSDYGFRSVDHKNVDLPSFYYATDITFNQHSSPYQNGSWQEAQTQLKQKVFPYLYPPPSLLLLAPYSWFSYSGLKLAVLLVNHLCVLLLIYLLLFRVFGGALTPASADDKDQGLMRWLLLPLLLLYTLQYHPLAVTMDHGQINLVVLVLFCLFWLALRARKSAWLVALPLALAIILKTYPILFLPLLLIRRKYMIAAFTSLYVGAMAVLSLVILPEKVWSDWINLVLPTGGYGQSPGNVFSPAIPWNQSLNGFAARTFLHPIYAMDLNPAMARIIPYLAASLIIFTLVLLAVKLTRRHESRYVNDEFVLVLLSIFLIAPLSWEHHLVFVLPAAMLALIHMTTGKTPIKIMVPVGLAIGLMAWPMPFIYKITDHGPMGLLVSLKLFAVAVLWMYFAGRMFNLLRLKTKFSR